MKFAKKYLVGLALAAPLALAATTTQADGPLAEGLDKFLGSIYAPSQIEDFEKYFNQVVAENAGKWGAVVNNASDLFEASDYPPLFETELDWAGSLDGSVQLALDNGFPYRFHVLVWGRQQPAFMGNYEDDQATQLMAIEAWFEAVAQEYGEHIKFLEVVNEPVNDPPNSESTDGISYIDALGGAEDHAWLITAYEMAREHFPESSQLMINEYNVINGGVIEPYLEMVETLIEHDLLDAIGFQAHAFSTAGTTTETLQTNLDRLASYGLPLYVTEMDIDAPDGNEQTQLREYRRVFPLFWEHEAVEGVTLWGFRPGMWRGEATLIREDGSERPALQWLRCYMDGQRNPGAHAGIFPGQEITVPTNADAGAGHGQIIDCYGSNSSPTDDWHVTGGTGQSVLEVTSEGGIARVSGATFEQNSYTLDIVARAGDLESEPMTVNVVIDGFQDSPPSTELPGGGGSSSGSTNLLFLTLLSLIGLGRWGRRRH